MLRTLVFALLLIAGVSSAQIYSPTPANLKARKQFQDMKFGMFIHWGTRITC